MATQKEIDQMQAKLLGEDNSEIEAFFEHGDCDCDAKDKSQIDMLGRVAILLKVMTDGYADTPPDQLVGLAKQCFGIRQVLLKMINCSEASAPHCPLCGFEKISDGTACPHGDYVRAAIMLMSLFKLNPEPDMDLMAGDQEIPDLDGTQGIPEAS
jgi:hypothetical protein